MHIIHYSCYRQRIINNVNEKYAINFSKHFYKINNKFNFELHITKNWTKIRHFNVPYEIYRNLSIVLERSFIVGYPIIPGFFLCIENTDNTFYAALICLFGNGVCLSHGKFASPQTTKYHLLWSMTIGINKQWKLKDQIQTNLIEFSVDGKLKFYLLFPIKSFIFTSVGTIKIYL